MSSSLFVALLSSFRVAPIGVAVCALAACAKEEPKLPAVEEGETPSILVAEETTADATEEALVAVEEDATGAEDEAEKADEVSEEGKSLRDRITTTPAPESATPTWSMATTPEERRENLEKALAAESEPYVIDMHDLGGWELDEREENPIPDYIMALDGKEFVMRGFMMPDIDFEHIRSFHLVRSLFSCCFGAPPQINEIMRVTLADEDGMDYTYNTLEIRGRLTVTFEVVDGLVEDIFRLENVTYRILEFDDPEAPKSFDASTGFDDVIPSGPQEY